MTGDSGKRALVQRIADSSGFRSAPRLREFLLFITECALSGRSDEISEQHIGHEVFRRAADYDTANDNIVRVSARQLRIKLKEYAERDGADDPWVLEVPKGGYVPVFTPREQQAAVTRPKLNWKWLAAAVVILAAMAAWALTRGRNSQEAPLTDLVVRPAQRTVVILADSSLVLLHELTGRVLTADEYASRTQPQEPDDPKLRSLTRSIASQQLTSVADVGLAVRLLRLRPDAADRISVVHARNAGPRTLKDQNAILLGGPRSNPWTKLFEERLNFRFDFSGEMPLARIQNVRPRAGEQQWYETSRQGGTVTRAFARIALVPNLNHTGRVLLLSGTTIEATEAATEFFLGERSGAVLAQALGRAPSAANGFEVLLETTAIGGTARDARVVASRVY